jgi:probable rRNA maturation factor
VRQTVNISIAPEFRPLLDRYWLRRAVKSVLDAESITGAVEVGLLITGDTTVRRLNRDYRGLDRTTDVLSFALGETGSEGFVAPPDSVRHLGEVIISFPQALRQAEAARHDLKKEMALLVVHGLLHLLGYDHVITADRRRMRARQKAILAKVKASLASPGTSRRKLSLRLF